MNNENAIEHALAQPAMIKRPLLIHKDQITLGFKASEYESVFS